MTRYCIALDIGTSGLRCQAIDLDTMETLASSITQRHPIPGMNVIDHVNFAMKNGVESATGLLLNAINALFKTLNVDLSKVEHLGVCGNPFQLSLFQGIEIRDLAYAGKNMLIDLGVEPPKRDGAVLSAAEVGLEGMPNAMVTIPPAVRHEIGADAMAMLLMTDALSETEPCIVADYGTNAEMALIHDGKIITGSAAAGPALEGQEIERGMLASPGAISDVNVTSEGWVCTVLDETMAPREGDTVDPKTGKVVKEGPMHGKAIGITGTGVVAALYCGLKTGLIVPPKIDTEDGKMHLQDGIDITPRDIEEAGKAIGALRAGFLTLLDEAGMWTGDIKKTYMSGASGLYVDAKKALSIGMVVPGVNDIVQFGNTSIGLARKVATGEMDLEELREMAKKLRADHCMFATSEIFKDIYSIEFSLWVQNMPMSEYNNMLAVYNIPPIPDPDENPTVKRITERDLPDTEKIPVFVLDNPGTMLRGIIEGCIFCRKCERVCPEGAIKITDEDDGRYANIRTDLCGGYACGRCERECPQRVLIYKSLKITEE
ncbi:MAG: methylamine methyltransferase corrinoid protein reductive activase [Candidatus Methanomethylophilaceae archaeon]|jgi:methylamine methyltransferase corrinoid activation protein